MTAHLPVDLAADLVWRCDTFAFWSPVSSPPATPKKPRGRTTTAEERSVAAKAEAALHAAGLDEARVRALATKPGKPARRSGRGR